MLREVPPAMKPELRLVYVRRLLMPPDDLSKLSKKSQAGSSRPLVTPSASSVLDRIAHLITDDPALVRVLDRVVRELEKAKSRHS